MLYVCMYECTYTPTFPRFHVIMRMIKAVNEQGETALSSPDKMVVYTKSFTFGNVRRAIVHAGTSVRPVALIPTVTAQCNRIMILSVIAVDTPSGAPSLTVFKRVMVGRSPSPYKACFVLLLN
ncbi:hypothetical protein QVD17_39697 [Tagetes erecta]|uniref:Uncharacterized protein n=1 Tax=Tagetes erecta TaxID=13708 RepID=A0AAD8JP05_TARER|nr:hypothetical protein QVD17_39697 [Tagetes erecta]